MGNVASIGFESGYIYVTDNFGRRTAVPITDFLSGSAAQSLYTAYSSIGRTYYVNNITGASANNGLSWDTPFAQPSEAIAASETFRELGGGAPTVTTNDYIANTICIQGTSTLYTGITDLGERCYILGISAGLMRDGGSGQVRIGSLTTDGCDDATNCRGNTVYNIQFLGGGNNMYAFRNTAWIQRSRFHEVTFMQGAADLEACFYAAAISGTVFERCHFVTNAGTSPALYSVQIAGQCSDNLWIGNTFGVGATAIFDIGTITLHTGTVIKNNLFQSLQTHTSAIGFLDGSTSCNALLAENYFAGDITLPISRAVNHRTVGNMLGGSATPFSINL